MLKEYTSIFPEWLPNGPPPKRVVDYEIDTIPGLAPLHKSPYRLSSAELDEMKRQINKTPRVGLGQSEFKSVRGAHPLYSKEGW